MKLIIDIPEVTANEIKDNAMFAKEIASSIKWDITGAITNGIPLEDIKAEIDKARYIDKDTRICKNALASGLEVAMEIIDKHLQKGE